MTGRVERFPRVPGGVALKSRVVPLVRTLAITFFQPIERVGPEKPKERGDHQTDGVFDDAEPRVEAKHFVGDDQKRRGPQHRPKPTEFYEVLVEECTAVGEIDFWESYEIAHQ